MLRRKFLIGTVIGVFLLVALLSTIWLIESPSESNGSATAQHVHDPDHSVGPAYDTVREIPPRKTHVPWVAVTDTAPIDRSIWHHLPSAARFVSLNQEFDQWLINTPLQLHIPQLETSYDAIVNRIVPSEFGATTIYAESADEESTFENLILTYNEVDTMAYIGTTHGSWELKGNHSNAWIVASRELKKNQDYSKPDLLKRNEFRYADAEYVPRLVSK